MILLIQVCIHIVGKSFLISISTLLTALQLSTWPVSTSITDFLLTHPLTALFLLSPGDVDVVRGEGRRPRHDDSSASTDT